jgi:hypothetical protein
VVVTRILLLTLATRDQPDGTALGRLAGQLVDRGDVVAPT